MATHQDLLDAIARVRAATGDRDAWQNGLSGEDIAAACDPLSTPGECGAVLAKVVAAHPAAFLSPAAPPPRANEGLAAEAIRDAETALAQQKSTAAQVDLQVVTAVLNAHAANAAGAAELNRLQREIEEAVLSRTDLDTPSGARQFQRYLIGKLRDIRTVVDVAGLDATSKASLAVALASLYAAASPEPGPPPEPRPATTESTAPQPNSADSVPPMSAEPAGWDMPPADFSEPADYGALLDYGALPAPPMPAAPMPAMPMPALPMPAPPPAMPTATPPPTAAPLPAAPMAPPGPAWGGGLPAGMPLDGGGLSTVARPDLARPDLPRREWDPAPPGDKPTAEDKPGPEDKPEDKPAAPPADQPAEDPTTVHLPDGTTVNAATPELAAAVTAAIAGTPIPEAFRQQGITLPPLGAAVIAPVEAGRLAPGDIGVLADRYALALGDGKALLDNQIRPIADVAAPGFLGWQHPPPPGPTTISTDPPEVPAPNRTAETAPS